MYLLERTRQECPAAQACFEFLFDTVDEKFVAKDLSPADLNLIHTYFQEIAKNPERTPLTDALLHDRVTHSAALCDFLSLRNQSDYAATVLLEYLRQKHPDQANEAMASEHVPTLLRKKGQLCNFSLLTNNCDYSIGDLLKHQIPRAPLAAEAGAALPIETLVELLPACHAHGLLKTKEMSSELFDLIFDRIKSFEGMKTEFTCDWDRANLLAAAIDAYRAVADKCGPGREKKALEECVTKLRGILVIDLHHLYDVDFGTERIKGLHVLPPEIDANGAPQTVQFGDAETREATVTFNYPRIFTNTTVNIPLLYSCGITNSIGQSTGAVASTKLSTFQLDRPTNREMIQDIEAVMRNPTSFVSRGNGPVYFGLDTQNRPRAVYTTFCRAFSAETNVHRLGTTFLLPFYEIRHRGDRDSNQLPLSTVKFVPTYQSAERTVSYPAHSELIRFFCSSGIDFEKYMKKSNRERGDLIRDMQAAIAQSGGEPFQIVPSTLPGGPLILTSTSKKLFGKTIVESLNSLQPARSSNDKRLTASQIENTFGSTSDFYLQYASWYELANYCMDHLKNQEPGDKKE